MPIDRFSGKFVVKTRDQIRNEYLVDYKFRRPDADISASGHVWVDASVAADAVAPLYFDAKLTASVVDIDNAVGKQLDQIGEADGITRQPESTAQGYVRATSSSGGGSVVQGARLRHQQTQALYQVLVSKSVSAADPLFAVASIATGTGVNLQVGAVLQFENPPIGLGSTVTVTGDGITGGGPEENDDDYRSRLKDARANPAAAANWAHYVKTVESVFTVNVEKAFAYPAVLGPGTVGVVFTTKPSSPGGARDPNGAQIATVEVATMNDDGMPVDDSALFGTIAYHDVEIALRVEWTPDAPGWVDSAPWPPASSPAVRVGNSSTPTATSFEVESVGLVEDPVAGKTIALWDPIGKKMVPKRIVGVTPSVDGWYLECDSTSPTSDASYVPTYGQRVSPWADSANELVQPVMEYMGRQGPGEQHSWLPDAGGRRRRHPVSPNSWPNVITNRILDGVFELDSMVSDAEVLEPSLPFPTTVGSPGVLSYLHRLSDLSMFSEA